MAKIIGLPKLSPTMDEGTLVRWAKKEGDKVDIDDLLAEVETDKATMEFRSFDRGVLLKILVPEGETLAPDTPVAIIGKSGEDVGDLVAKAKSGAKVPAAAPPEESKDRDQRPASPEIAKAEREAPRPKSGNGAGARAAAEPAPAAEARGGRVLASPLVRRMAREHGVELADVHGSGPGGRIVKRDLDERIAKGPSPAERPAFPSGGGATFERLPPRVEKANSTRRTIARRLTESKRDIPHYYLTIDVDAEPLWQARIALNATLEKAGEKVSLNDMIIKAVATALRRMPDVNASWVDGEIHRHQVVDISVAVAIPDGLITPVVRDADRKGILEISREVRELSQRAKDKKLKPEEFTGGTFSISNLGMYGIEQFTAVINPPEGAILAVGGVREEPVVKNGQLVPGRRMKMTMSCDHRVIDGALGAQWLAVLRPFLESPLSMLL